MAKSKKILYLVTQSEWGGAQKYIYDLATNLPNDFEVIVGAGLSRAKSRDEGNGELLKKLEHKNIKISKLKYIKRAIKPFSDILALVEIQSLIKKEKPNIIHLNSSKISILGSLASKWIIGHGSSIIYTVHGWVFNEPLPSWKKWLYLILERYTAKFKNKIICVSEFDKQVALKNQICKEDKLVTIHNGIDFDKLNFLNKQIAINNLTDKLPNSNFQTNFSSELQTSTIIGTIANLYKTKGLNYLIDSAKQITKDHPQTLFMVIGEGPERNYLEDQIKKQDLEKNFFLVGNVDEAYKYLKAFDIFVLPSVKEGFPYTILEALVAKLPIIATKVGGIPEIIQNDVNGIIVEPKNSKQLTSAINKLIDNQNLQKQLISNIDLHQFSLQRMIDKTKELY